MIMGNNQYFRLCKTLRDFGKLILETEDIGKYIDNQDVDFYLSLYKYNEEQYHRFNELGSISGINDVVTDRIVFDFDISNDSQSLLDTITDSKSLCDVLIKLGIPKENINIFYSGSKGFHVEFRSDKKLNQEEYKNIVYSLASNLKTFDDRIWNASRVLRLAYTKHQESGLYKTPIKYENLNSEGLSEILEIAKVKQKFNSSYLTKITNLPDVIYNKRKQSMTVIQNKSFQEFDDKVKIPASALAQFNPIGKPKWMTSCMYAISQGFFKKGERHDAIHRLAVLYQQQGFPKNVVQKILQGISDLQAERVGDKRRDDDQLDSEIMSVFDSRWRGGTYTCKTDHWLKRYCEKLGQHSCKQDADGIELLTIDDMTDRFEHFAKNIDKFIVKTGIESLDKKLKLMVGNVLGVLAAPSAGKSSFVVTMLNNMSKTGVECLFFSFDMFEKLLFQRLAQKHFKYGMEELYKIYQDNNTVMQDKIRTMIKEEYKNVGFCYQSGQTIEEIERSIIKRETDTGKKIKVIAVDYLELVDGEASDPTQSSLNIASGLKNLSTRLEILVILILQPQKVASKPDEPIKSFNNAKGSGMIGQSVSYFLGCHRDGLNPDYPGNDKFFTIRCLKNRTGELFSLDYSWDGLSGSIRELTPVEKIELEQFKERKKEDAKKDKNNDDWG